MLEMTYFKLSCSKMFLREFFQQGHRCFIIVILKPAALKLIFTFNSVLVILQIREIDNFI